MREQSGSEQRDHGAAAGRRRWLRPAAAGGRRPGRAAARAARPSAGAARPPAGPAARDPVRHGRPGLAAGARLRSAHRRGQGPLAQRVHHGDLAGTRPPLPGACGRARAGLRRPARHGPRRRAGRAGPRRRAPVECARGGGRRQAGLQAGRPGRPARRGRIRSGRGHARGPRRVAAWRPRRAGAAAGPVRGSWPAGPRRHRDLGVGRGRAGVHRAAVHQDRAAAGRPRDARHRRLRFTP